MWRNSVGGGQVPPSFVSRGGGQGVNPRAPCGFAVKNVGKCSVAGESVKTRSKSLKLCMNGLDLISY